MESKQRHGCVTAWLILMIIANSAAALTYLLMGDTISQGLPNPLPQSMIWVLTITSVANLIFAIMLLQWKKWAFWAFAASSLLVLIINLTNGLGIGTSLTGLAGVVVLYAVLQIKQDGVTAWENLE